MSAPIMSCDMQWIFKYSFKFKFEVHYVILHSNCVIRDINTYTYLNHKPIFEWYVVRCDSKNKYQKHIYLR